MYRTAQKQLDQMRVQVERTDRSLAQLQAQIDDKDIEIMVLDSPSFTFPALFSFSPLVDHGTDIMLFPVYGTLCSRLVVKSNQLMPLVRMRQ
jgi:uncharacterized UPF0160 family protein